MAEITIDGLAFSVEGLLRDAEEIAGWGAGNEAAQVRWAASELVRLHGLLRANNIDPRCEYFCSCGVRHGAPVTELIPF